MRPSFLLALIFAAVLAPLTTHAASALDRQLARSLGGASAGGSTLHESAAGRWLLLQDPKTPGLNCALSFISKNPARSTLGFVGPTAESPAGLILFTGAEIPKASALGHLTVQLDTTGDPSQTLRAMHAPHGGDAGALAVATDIKTTVAALDDVEAVTLQLAGKTVYQLNYQGGHIARDALQKCLAAAGAPR